MTKAIDLMFNITNVFISFSAVQQAEKLYLYLGEQAETCFKIFKKRYLRRRNEYRKCVKSGISSSVAKKTRNAYEEYSFFKWIEKFLKHRSTKSEWPMSWKKLYDAAEKGIDVTDEKLDDNAGQAKIPVLKVDNELNNSSMEGKFYGKRRKDINTAAVGQFEPRLLHLKEPVEKDPVKERIRSKGRDKEDLYGAFIASELRSFDERERCIIKHEISDVLFQHQMRKFSASSNQYYTNMPSGAVMSYHHQVPLQRVVEMPVEQRNTRNNSPSPSSSITSVDSDDHGRFEY